MYNVTLQSEFENINSSALKCRLKILHEIKSYKTTTKVITTWTKHIKMNLTFWVSTLHKQYKILEEIKDKMTFVLSSFLFLRAFLWIFVFTSRPLINKQILFCQIFSSSIFIMEVFDFTSRHWSQQFCFF